MANRGCFKKGYIGSGLQVENGTVRSRRGTAPRWLKISSLDLKILRFWISRVCRFGAAPVALRLEFSAQSAVTADCNAKDFDLLFAIAITFLGLEKLNVWKVWKIRVCMCVRECVSEWVLEWELRIYDRKKKPTKSGVERRSEQKRSNCFLMTYMMTYMTKTKT